MAWLRSLVMCTRGLFLTGICLLVAGASLEGQYTKMDLSKIGLRLVKAGYVVLAIIFGLLLAFQVFFWIRREQLSKGSKTVSHPYERARSS